MILLLWASKFATAKSECSFEIGKYAPLWVPFILLLCVPETSSVAIIEWVGLAELSLNYLSSQCFFFFSKSFSFKNRNVSYLDVAIWKLLFAVSMDRVD